MTQPTQLTAMQTSAVAPPKTDAPMSLLTGSGFDQIQRVAKALAGSTLVPVQYRAFTEVKQGGKVTGYQPNGAGLPNCIVALNMAQRMGADPLMVMQNLYVIEGRPSWSSQFIIAAINSCGRFSPLRFEMSEPGETEKVEYEVKTWINNKPTQVKKTASVQHRTCRAWVIEKDTGDRLDGPTVSIQMAIDEGWLTKNGSKWLTMPEVMLRYRAASLLGRLYAPELLMGLQSREEVEDFIDAKPDGAGNFAVDLTDLRDKEPEPPSVIDDDADEADVDASILAKTASETGKTESDPTETATDEAKAASETAETDTKPADTVNLQLE